MNFDKVFGKKRKSFEGETFLDIWAMVLIGIVACLLVAELFLIPAQPQTFDGWTHLITINKFHTSLRQLHFPVGWTDGVANYGFPLGQIAHQVPAYLGAVLMFITNSTLLSYNIVWLIGSLISSLAVYWWLRSEFKLWPSLTGAILFCLAPYRITNIYVRGALPEFFAGVFIPLIGLGLFQWIKKGKQWGWLLALLSTTGLALTHPMMMFPGFILLGIYGLYLLWPIWPLNRNVVVSSIKMSAVFAGGLLLSSYYLVPLFLETKYFYYGSIDPRQRIFEFISWKNYFIETWNYQGELTLGVRENRLQFGLPETLIVCGAAILVLWFLIKRKNFSQWILWWLVAALIGVLFTISYTAPLYEHIKIIASLQHPWRFFTMLIFVPPVCIAWMLQSIPQKKYQILAAILIIVGLGWYRFPHLYGKNYVNYPEARYNFAIVNLHSTNMNTVWSGETWDYPVVSESASLVEGEGTLKTELVDYTTRRYTVDTVSDSRIVVYTFYFPGWQLLVNGQPHQIEFQDNLYRGVMTFRLSPGHHLVELKFGDTNLRLFGKLLTVGTAAAIIVLLISKKIMDKKKKKLSLH